MSGTLVGGIGNIFLGDDGFGVEVVRRLAEKPPRPGVHLADFGIRSLDLAYAMLGEYDDIILVDAMPRGNPPGTLCVLEPPRDPPAVPQATTLGLAAHGFPLADALTLVPALSGKSVARVRIVGCEPASVPPEGDVYVGLSTPVAQAVDQALELIEEMVTGQTHG